METYQRYSRKKTSAGSDELPLAMAYVPMQRWGNLYSPEEGLQRATIFRDLDFPFRGKGGCRR